MASGTDILGKFYEKFLKYGNGAKEIGIVLTPRHITKFAADVLDVNYRDYVLDPACGTGGFLVSAFDRVKNNANEKQIEKFRNYNLFGIEKDDEVVALALVNMVFRGDGRNNMKSGSCFQKNILKTNIGQYETGKEENREGKENKTPLITKVLMNPPFALKKGDDKESHFIDYALSQMEDGGLLFAILPVSVMIESVGREWRKNLLKKNTLLSVVTFPVELFYPIGVHAIGIFLKKGVPHRFKQQHTYFAKANTDGFVKLKGKRIQKDYESNRIEEIKEELTAFISNQNINVKSIPEYKKVVALDIDMDDKSEGIELVPEVYLDTDYSTLSERNFEDSIKQYVAFNLTK